MDHPVIENVKLSEIIELNYENKIVSIFRSTQYIYKDQNQMFMRNMFH